MAVKKEKCHCKVKETRERYPTKSSNHGQIPFNNHRARYIKKRVQVEKLTSKNGPRIMKSNMIDPLEYLHQYLVIRPS